MRLPRRSCRGAIAIRCSRSWDRELAKLAAPDHLTRGRTRERTDATAVDLVGSCCASLRRCLATIRAARDGRRTGSRDHRRRAWGQLLRVLAELAGEPRHHPGRRGAAGPGRGAMEDPARRSSPARFASRPTARSISRGVTELEIPLESSNGAPRGCRELTASRARKRGALRARSRRSAGRSCSRIPSSTRARSVRRAPLELVVKLDPGVTVPARVRAA